MNGTISYIYQACFLARNFLVSHFLTGSLSFYVFVLCLVVEWGKTHFLRYMAGGFDSILRKYPVGIPLSEAV